MGGGARARFAVQHRRACRVPPPQRSLRRSAAAATGCVRASMTRWALPPLGPMISAPTARRLATSPRRPSRAGRISTSWAAPCVALVKRTRGTLKSAKLTEVDRIGSAARGPPSRQKMLSSEAGHARRTLSSFPGSLRVFARGVRCGGSRWGFAGKNGRAGDRRK